MDKLDENRPFEGKTEVVKGVREEDVTREALIEISYLEPNIGVPAAAAAVSPKNVKFNKANEPLVHDGKELYRDKLISISNTPSAAVNALPHFPAQLDA